MNTIILFYTIGGAFLFVLWVLLSRWTNRRGQSTEVQRLKQQGELLMARIASMSTDEALTVAERLLTENTFVTTPAGLGEIPPILLRDLPAWPRELLERYKLLVIPEASIEVGWSHLGTPLNGTQRIGRAHEIGEDVIVETASGRVLVGRDSFSSLAHFFVFEAE